VVVGAPVSGPGVDRFEHAVRPGQRGGHRIGVGVDVRQARTGDSDEVRDSDERAAAWTHASFVYVAAARGVDEQESRPSRRVVLVAPAD
jgi:hypothetical protein